MSFLEQMQKGDHAILFYDSPQNKHDVLFNYLSLGVREGLAYITTEETPDQIREGMQRFGINVKDRERRGQLVVKRYDEFYLIDGDASTARIMNQWSELARKCVSTGLEGIRVTGETTCFFRSRKISELVRYEYALHRKVDLPARVICAYNIVEMYKAGALETIMPMVRAHDPVIFMGPGGGIVLSPEMVEDKDVEEIMQVKIREA
jgi:hypothetical protein